MFYDEFYSLKDGPICSSTLNCLNGQLDKDVWSVYVRKEGKKGILLALAHDERDEISQSDLDILESVWDKFGWMSTSQVRQWTHLHCAEYTEVSTGRLPIDYVQIARVLHLDDPNEIGDHVSEYRSANAALAE